MRKVLLVRFGEVYLKGLNRPYFLKRLTDNIRHAVQPIGGHVWLSDSRIYVSNAEDLEECARRVCRVFGVHSVSYAYELDKNWEEIVSACVEAMKPLSGTFKVLARRSDKTFPMDSMTMAGELGYEVLKSNPTLAVDVHHPAHKLNVEIRDFAYVSVGEIPAVGGMPLGTGGRAALLLSGGIDSPVAGYHLMRRGVVVEAIHFQSPPYTSERAKEKVLALAKILGEYGGGMRVHLVPFTKIQMEIHEKCPDGLGTVLMRRYMMRIAERIARKNHAQALVTGESLGQVASQTMEAIGCTDAVVHMPVFRPLIGLDKLEITEQAVRIGSYETSILPYEDCCTVFTPRHPNTRPRPDMLEEAEQALDTEALVREAVDATEVIKV